MKRSMIFMTALLMLVVGAAGCVKTTTYCPADDDSDTNNSTSTNNGTDLNNGTTNNANNTNNDINNDTNNGTNNGTDTGGGTDTNNGTGLNNDTNNGTDTNNATDLPKGTYFGTMWNTYYYVPLESDYSGSVVTIYDSDCNPIADVPDDFTQDLCIEGSGRLDDGRVVNYDGSCGCGPVCNYNGRRLCYRVLDPNQYPWGAGASSNALVPLHSIAVDRNFISLGTVLYMEEWDGVTIPAVDGIGGEIHDGCFTADDVGGAINDDHFDFFSGSHDMWRALEQIYPTGSRFTVYTDSPRCAGY